MAISTVECDHKATMLIQLDQVRAKSGTLIQAALLCSLALTGCATGGSRSGVIQHPFPDADKLASIASRAAPDITASFETAALSVQAWDLVGPFPAGPVEGSEPVHDPFTTALAGQLRPATPTAGMHCLARELANFAGRNGGTANAPNTLRAYFGARCFAAPVNSRILVTQLSGENVELTEQLRSQLIENYTKQLGSLPAGDEFGTWVGEIDGRIMAALVVGKPSAQVESLGASWDEHKMVRIGGRVHEPTEWLQATVTQGPLGYGACKPTPGTAVVLPDFDFQCPLDENDDVALLSLVAGAPGELLGHTKLLISITRAGDSGKRVELLQSRASGDNLSAESFVTAVNDLRLSLNQPELSFSSAQSATAAKLLPHYVVATQDEDTSTINTIAMGMMAGWDIDKPIRNAGMLSYTSRAQDSSPDLLAEMLFLPSNRMVLLDPELRTIALAVYRDEASHGATTLASTYKFFEDMNYAPHEAALLDEIDRQRAAKKLPPVERIGGEQVDAVFDPVMRQLAAGEIQPRPGLMSVLEHYSSKLNRNFSGYTMATMNLDGWMPSFEGDLMTLGKAAVTVRIGHHTSPESSWGQFVVYIVYMPQ